MKLIRREVLLDCFVDLNQNYFITGTAVNAYIQFKELAPFKSDGSY